MYFYNVLYREYNKLKACIYIYIFVMRRKKIVRPGFILNHGVACLYMNENLYIWLTYLLGVYTVVLVIHRKGILRVYYSRGVTYSTNA